MFLKNKYTRWYQSLIQKALTENRVKRRRSSAGFVYYESHHIIPRCMGGTEEVLLTAKEHYICHLLLCKMVEGNNKHKMINALIKMTYSKGRKQDRYTARSFDIVRSLIAKRNSEMFKGVPKSLEARQNMKGRSGTWVRNEEHKKRMVGRNNPGFGRYGSLNVMSDPEIRKKVSESKLGTKRVYREDGSYYYERKI